ncbi:MAG TPA: hypothetical protein PLE16_08290 [Spirochaetota bacterium]|jgi:hypothetical protein|nr:hypothetical protein [Spirochaetota bacterium]HOH36062.1 hypothetical protein [Spirochaetota bacterium]HPJ14218.1 hypothetical protein [Spirochaetota bacterium]HPM34580.1 hypothetical protein [Spirochaetota bacterium]HPY01980.1 hypothetical protein [Spirochaetota bacterium]
MESDTFAKLFDLIRNGYTKPVILQDVSTGFSTCREYSNEILNKLKISNNKKYISLIKIWLKNDCKEELQPVLVNITFNLFEDKYYKADYADIRKLSFKPIDIEVDNLYFYDINNNTFLKNNKSISPLKILEESFNCHIKTTKTIAGFILRHRIKFRRFVANIFLLKAKFLIFMLYIIAGEEYEYTLMLSNFQNMLYSKKDQKEKSNNKHTLKIFEYTSSAWSITTYCMLHLIIYVLFACFDYKPKPAKYMIENNFLLIMYSIATIVFWDKLLPKIFKSMIKKCVNMYYKIILKKLKV